MILDIAKILWATVLMLLLFNLTIFIHELGHFLVGLWRGAKIEKFAIWFGPAIWSKTVNGIEYRLGCIPLGGYVAFPQLSIEAIEGKSETPVEELQPLKPLDKILILFAGSLSNVFLGLAIAVLVWVFGIPKDKSTLDLKVGYVVAESPEGQAGIQPGDVIVSINDKPVKDWDDIFAKVALSLTEKVAVGVDRQGTYQTCQVLPARDNLFKIRRLNLEPRSIPVANGIEPNSPAEKAGIKVGDEFLKVDGEPVLGPSHLISLIRARPNQATKVTLLRDGVVIEKEVIPKLDKNSVTRIGLRPIPKGDDEKITVHPTPWSQVTKIVLDIANTLNALIHHKTTGVGAKDLAGPVRIGSFLYQMIDIDIRLALAFLVVININLAVINLLPIPVLDGGWIVFSLIEWIRRRPLSIKFMEITQTVFVALIAALAIYITFNDISWLARFGMGRPKDAAKETAIPAFEEKK